jgi:hypothetical protein
MDVRIALLALGLAALSGCVDAPDPLFEELPPEVIAESLEVRATSIGCPGIPSGITSYRGFVGSYIRYGTAYDGQISTLAVRSMIARSPDASAVSGTWDGVVRRGALSAIERGTFDAIADNPAIGAVISLRTTVPSTITQPTTYFVLGVTRNWLGNVASMCLLGGSATSSTPFAIYRVGF